MILVYVCSESLEQKYIEEYTPEFECYLGGEIKWVQLDPLCPETVHLIFPNGQSFKHQERFKFWVLRKRASFNVRNQSFHHYVLEKGVNSFDQTYLNLLEEIQRAPERQTRNSLTRSVFCRHLKFDLSYGFPLLTTKRMFWKGILEEFLFFIRGDTDTSLLEKKGVRIWTGNTSRSFLNQLGMKNRPEKIMGPMYGYQWRFFNADYDESTGKPLQTGIDQLVQVIRQIQRDATSRRHLLTDYNPSQASQGVLYPCHSLIIQFYVEGSRLSMFCYNRSSDVFLGLPFNIASSSLLLYVIARLVGLEPYQLFLSLGDCHIYADHEQAVKNQLDPSRIPYNPPRLDLKLDPLTPQQTDAELCEILQRLTVEHFNIVDYQHHSTISAPMIA
jgi:dihydrofolate reductase/thymidylate synthase